MWEVTPFEITPDLYNHCMNPILSRTEYLYSRDTGSSIWGFFMCSWKTDKSIIQNNLKEKRDGLFPVVLKLLTEGLCLVDLCLKLTDFIVLSKNLFVLTLCVWDTWMESLLVCSQQQQEI